MEAHFTQINDDPFFDETDHFGDVYLRRRELIVGGTKKIMVAFGSLAWGTDKPEPDWINWDGSEKGIKIKTDDDNNFTPPYEMENLASLVLFTWMNLDGEKPRIHTEPSGRYLVTGNLEPTPQELWEMLLETFAATPKPRKWFDYHVRDSS